MLALSLSPCILTFCPQHTNYRAICPRSRSLPLPLTCTVPSVPSIIEQVQCHDSPALCRLSQNVPCRFQEPATGQIPQFQPWPAAQPSLGLDTGDCWCASHKELGLGGGPGRCTPHVSSGLDTCWGDPLGMGSFEQFFRWERRGRGPHVLMDKPVKMMKHLVFGLTLKAIFSTTHTPSGGVPCSSLPTR